MPGVTGDGLRAFAAALPEKLKGAVSREAFETAERARALCPVATGRLRESISAHEDGVSADAPYAFIVEEGSRAQAARPFLCPAADMAAFAEKALAAVAELWKEEV